MRDGPHTVGDIAAATEPRRTPRQPDAVSMTSTEGLEPRQLRSAFARFATGVTVVTTASTNGRLHGVTANSFSSVSLDPPLILWSLAAKAASLPSFHAAAHFAVNVLGQHQLDLAQTFAMRGIDKYSGVVHSKGLGGCPLLTGSLAHFECATETVVPAGDHIIFIGRVLRASTRDGRPLLFWNGAYGQAADLDPDATG